MVIDLGGRAALAGVLLAVALAGCGRLATIDRYDVAAEAVMAGALAVDGVQSARAERWCVESNPLLGNCGGGMAIPVYFAGVAVLHAAVVVLLPPGRWRTAFEAFTLGGEGATVYRNRQRERELPYLTH